MKDCPNCGTQVHDDVIACPECGGRWDQTGAFAPPPPPAAPLPATRVIDMTADELERLVRKTVVDIAAIAVFIAVIIIVIALCILDHSLTQFMFHNLA